MIECFQSIFMLKLVVFNTYLYIRFAFDQFHVIKWITTTYCKNGNILIKHLKFLPIYVVRGSISGAILSATLNISKFIGRIPSLLSSLYFTPLSLLMTSVKVFILYFYTEIKGSHYTDKRPIYYILRNGQCRIFLMPCFCLQRQVYKHTTTFLLYT